MVQWWRTPVDGLMYDVDPSTVLATAEPGWEPGRHPFGFDSTLAKAWRLVATEELVTIAAAANSNTANTSILPAGALIMSVAVRVTVAIPTAVTFSVGDSSQVSRFASGVTVAANTTAVGILQWNPTLANDTLGPKQTANAAVRITPNATPANANGRVRVVVVALVFTPPVS